LGVICGAARWTEIEAFGLAKEPWLRQFSALPTASPRTTPLAACSPPWIRRSARGPKVTRWVAALEERTGGRVIALDGKTLRRSHDRTAGRKGPPLHLVSAWASANR